MGVLFSSTGTMAESEAPLRDATLLAIDQINAGGGVWVGSERRLRLKAVVADGGSTPEQFAHQAQSMLSHGVQVIFGCWTSDCRTAVLKVLEGHGGLLYYPLQFEGYEESPAAIYSGLTANQQLFPALDYLRQNSIRSLYLVGSDYVFPHRANQLARAYWRKHRGRIVGESYRPRGSEDFSEIVRSIAASHCDAVLNTVNGSSQTAFFEAYHKAGLRHPVMSLSLSEAQASRLGHLTDGHFAAWGYFMALQSPRNQRFVQAYRGAYGADRLVDDPCQTAYSQVLAFARAVSLAGSSEPTLVRRATAAMILDTPAGLVRYEPKNLYCWRTVRIGQFRGGTAQVVWSSEVPQRPVPRP